MLILTGGRVSSPALMNAGWITHAHSSRNSFSGLLNIASTAGCRCWTSSPAPTPSEVAHPCHSYHDQLHCVAPERCRSPLSNEVLQAIRDITSFSTLKSSGLALWRSKSHEGHPPHAYTTYQQTSDGPALPCSCPSPFIHTPSTKATAITALITYCKFQFLALPAIFSTIL